DHQGALGDESGQRRRRQNEPEAGSIAGVVRKKIHRAVKSWFYLKWEHLKSERLRLRSWTSVRGGSGKHLPAIRQRYFRAIGHFRSILGAIAGDRDLIARFQGILLPPCPPQNQRWSEFAIPIRYVALF